MELPKLLLLVFSLYCSSQNYVEGDGKIFVRFDKYTNPGGLGANGQCCDGRWGACQSNGCDHKFTVCLHTVHHDKEIPFEDCEYGYVRTGEIKNHDTINFGHAFGGVSNPLTFTFPNAAPEEVKFMVEVWDDDDIFNDDYVEFLRDEIQFPNDPLTPFPFIVEGRTKLETTVWCECDEDWYGRECGVYCPPPQPGDNYYCDPADGSVVCRPGWTGDYCSDKITTPRTTYPTTTKSTPKPTTTPTTTMTKPTTTYTTPTTTTPNPTTTTPKPTTTYTTPTTTTPKPTTTYTIPETTYPTPTTPAFRGHPDCQAWAQAGHRYKDGVYTIQSIAYGPFTAWCDMNSYGEGWTVIQRRLELAAHTNFFRGWSHYKDGFGSVGGRTEYWLGLENIHQMTNSKSYKLHINVQIGNGEWRWARYEKFWIDDEDDKYTLHVEGFDGNAGDALQYSGLGGKRYHEGQPFSTYDNDNDQWDDGNCAKRYKSGWWFNDCAWANLNGVYAHSFSGWPPCRGAKCIAWRTIAGYEDYSLLAVEMSIHPN